MKKYTTMLCICFVVQGFQITHAQEWYSTWKNKPTFFIEVELDFTFTKGRAKGNLDKKDPNSIQKRDVHGFETWKEGYGNDAIRNHIINHFFKGMPITIKEADANRQVKIKIKGKVIQRFYELRAKECNISMTIWDDQKGNIYDKSKDIKKTINNSTDALVWVFMGHIREMMAEIDQELLLESNHAYKIPVRYYGSATQINPETEINLEVNQGHLSTDAQVFASFKPTRQSFTLVKAPIYGPGSFVQMTPSPKKTLLFRFIEPLSDQDLQERLQTIIYFTQR